MEIGYAAWDANQKDYNLVNLKNDSIEPIMSNYKTICGMKKEIIYPKPCNSMSGHIYTDITHVDKSPVCYNMMTVSGQSKNICAEVSPLKQPILYQTYTDGNPIGMLRVGPEAKYQTVENLWNNWTSRRLI